MKVCKVKEIVSSGGAVSVDELEGGGRHLSPREFHDCISSHENVVMIDVRNTFEFDVGHFINPLNNQAAENPGLVTFSSFDSFCAKKENELREKKVLMYCTGGIRCEKASVMLKDVA